LVRFWFYDKNRSIKTFILIVAHIFLYIADSVSCFFLGIIIILIKTTIGTIKANTGLTFPNHSFSIESDNTFTIFYFAFLNVTGLSSVYRIIVIALSCIVLVLLIAVGLLTWRLSRALINKREKTQEGGTSCEVEHHDTSRDQHESQGDGYLEPLEVMPPAISHYQSVHSNGTSAKYDNLVSNSGTDNGEEDQLYLTIIP